MNRLQELMMAQGISIEEFNVSGYNYKFLNTAAGLVHAVRDARDTISLRPMEPRKARESRKPQLPRNKMKPREPRKPSALPGKAMTISQAILNG